MVSIEKLKQLDYDYSYKLANLFDKDSPVRIFFQLITLTGTFIAWFVGLSLAMIFLGDYRVETASLVFITGFMLIPVFIIKQTVRRSRPSYKDDRFNSTAFDKFSFPSGHATRAAYTMIIMPIYLPSMAIFWIVWGTIMILSRLIIGVHYISDIITGIIIGISFMIIFILLGWVPVIPFVADIIHYLNL